MRRSDRPRAVGVACANGRGQLGADSADSFERRTGDRKNDFCRALATCLGVDFFQIAASHDILKLTGLGPPWRGATVGALAKALGKSPDGGDEQGCGNPVVLIDELDKAGGQIRSADGGGDGGGFFDQLLCIEPQNANLIDAFLGDTMPICVRYVSWIFTANNTEKIPDYLLSRIEIFDISQPTPADYRNGLLHSIFGSLVEELPYGGLFAPVLTSEVIDHLAESGMSPREIRRALEEAMEGAVCTYADTPTGVPYASRQGISRARTLSRSAPDRLHSGDCSMRENDNEEQGGGCDIDFASILLEIEPGYVVLTDQARGSKILFVPRAMRSRRGLRPARFRARW